MDWVLLEDAEDTLLGETDCKDGEGPGKASTDELLDSGVWPVKPQIHKQLSDFL